MSTITLSLKYFKSVPSKTNQRFFHPLLFFCLRKKNNLHFEKKHNPVFAKQILYIANILSQAFKKAKET